MAGNGGLFFINVKEIFVQLLICGHFVYNYLQYGAADFQAYGPEDVKPPGTALADQAKVRDVRDIYRY